MDLGGIKKGKEAENRALIFEYCFCIKWPGK